MKHKQQPVQKDLHSSLKLLLQDLRKKKNHFAFTGQTQRYTDANTFFRLLEDLLHTHERETTSQTLF